MLRKVLALLFFLTSFLLLPFFAPVTIVEAATCNPAIVVGNPEVPEKIYAGQDFEIKLKMDSKVAEAGDLVLLLTTGNAINPWDIASETLVFDPKAMISRGEDTLSFQFKGSNVVHPFDKYIMRLKYLRKPINPLSPEIRTYSEVCNNMGTVKVATKEFEDIGVNCKISLPDNIQKDSQDFKMTYSVPDVKVFYSVLEGTPDKVKPTGTTTYYKGTTMVGLVPLLRLEGNYMKEVSPPTGTVDLNGWGITGFDLGTYRVALNAWVYRGSGVGGYFHGFTCAHKDFKVTNTPTTEATEGKSTANNSPTNKVEKPKAQTCADTGDCTVAAGDIDQAKKCLNTAIGCIPIQLNSFINALLVWTAGIAGGIAFLLMIFGSLQMLTSQGNPEQLKKGREQFIAAISGLLFIIFSITLLQIIGADILGIPGFTR